MPYSPADSLIFSTLFSVPPIAEIFSDTHSIACWLAVEAALARAQERLHILPAGVGQAITQATGEVTIDPDKLRAGVERAGLPIIDLVEQLRSAVDDDAASYVHWGATTQDIMDTALLLQLRDALTHIERDLLLLIEQLAKMADAHRDTLMAGRTHSQQALPFTFGLKVATWLAPLLRHQQRLLELKPRLLTVQFGGACGTLASLGESGIAVVEALAQELELAVPQLPWHTQRDNLAEIAGWLSLLSGSLAKMAQDVILLAQSEVGEVRESADPSRGGSSTMAQKSNPVISEVIVAAARTNASLLASMHQALLQEHERATHGWQMEWMALPQMFGLTAAALEKARFLSENLVVDAARMRTNVEASNGMMMAEAITFALAEHMPHSEAKRLVSAAVAVALSEGHHLVDVVQRFSTAPVDWAPLRDERNYLGATHPLIDRVLAAVAAAGNFSGSV